MKYLAALAALTWVGLGWGGTTGTGSTTHFKNYIVVEIRITYEPHCWTQATILAGLTFKLKFNIIQGGFLTGPTLILLRCGF